MHNVYYFHFSKSTSAFTFLTTPQLLDPLLFHFPSANVPGVVVVATNTTSVRVSWLAVQLPPDGTLTGYTVYYRSLPNTSKRQSGGYTSQTFPPCTTSGDITNLNPNIVYQFNVVAMVIIMGQLYITDVPPAWSDSPTISQG